MYISVIQRYASIIYKIYYYNIYNYMFISKYLLWKVVNLFMSSFFVSGW